MNGISNRDTDWVPDEEILRERNGKDPVKAGGELYPAGSRLLQPDHRAISLFQVCLHSDWGAEQSGFDFGCIARLFKNRGSESEDSHRFIFCGVQHRFVHVLWPKAFGESIPL
ncbi:hypothetical protein LA10_02247 [Thermotoga neapolitana LA10]|nr:hypothetical protein LA10_02247 [Thermotoga neapolitana LA10]